MTEHRDHLSPEEAAAAADPNVGTGTAETAPYEDPVVSLLRRYPVALAGLVIFLPAATAAVTAWSTGQTLTAVVTTATAVLIATLTPFVHRAVTAVARPRLDADTPLIPAPRAR